MLPRKKVTQDSQIMTSRRKFIKSTALLTGAAFGWQHLDGPFALANAAQTDREGATNPGAGPASGPYLDLAPFGYEFRANRPTGLNDPETRWLTNGQADILAGIMWEEHRPVRQVELVFARPAPDPAQLRLEITTNTPTAKQENRPTWWTRQFEAFPGRAPSSEDGLQIVYQTDRETMIQRLKQYPKDFQYEADPNGLVLADKIRLRYLGTGQPPIVTAMRVYGISRLTSLRFVIEWGFLPSRKKVGFDGQIEAYNGRVRTVEPMKSSTGVVMTGSFAWHSAPGSKGRCGVEVEIWYLADDTQAVKFQPSADLPTGSNGSLVYHPNRTTVTVHTKGGSFTFAPRDLAAGKPILVPSLGFCVLPSGHGFSAETWRQQLASQKKQTLRQRVRQMPEQSLARALNDQYTAKRPAYPPPESEPPMKIEVPDELAAMAWRLAFAHVKRRCIKQGDTYLLYIWPYRALLGQESWRIFEALDLLGEHEIPRSGFGPWFQSQGKFVARGLFADKVGALNVDGWDLNHAQGHGSMLYAMAQHYRLSGDQAWLAEHLESFKAACEWVVRQRNHWLQKAGPDTWSSGLIPPSELGDYADWRTLYQTNLFFWRGLKHAAEAVATLEPKTGARFLHEAEALRQATMKAVERSITLAPVIRVQDGTYRRNIPPQPYVRGLCDQITNPFGGAHAGSLVMDSDLGAAALGLGLLPGDDPRMDELLDILEDDLYQDNWMVRLHQQTRMPNHPEAWFSIGGYYYQCGYSSSALAHLFRDDVPNYLRSMFNQYAADVDPDKGYQFREHPNRTGEGNGGDKTFEVAAFLERMRAMFVMEDGAQLWLARGTPRAWLEQGKRISIKNAPSHYGTVAYEIVSDVEHGRITATVEMPARQVGPGVLLRFRHPKGVPIQKVGVNGKNWKQFDKAREIIRLSGVKGTVKVTANY
jgi:hypothetical protein